MSAGPALPLTGCTTRCLTQFNLHVMCASPSPSPSLSVCVRLRTLQGDLGSKVLSRRPSGTVWKRGTVAYARQQASLCVCRTRALLLALSRSLLSCTAGALRLLAASVVPAHAALCGPLTEPMMARPCADSTPTTGHSYTRRGVPVSPLPSEPAADRSMPADNSARFRYPPHPHAEVQQS